MGTSTDLRTSVGFPPIAGEDARVLVLGSLPSEASLRVGEYYAHPQNAFWRIMKALTGASGDYSDRCQALMSSGVAVWDVLASSVRPGSMDADIRMSSAVPNDFETFFSEHERLRLVAFNGRKAQQMFQRFVMSTLSIDELEFQLLPSTSPAYASMSFAEKLETWRGIIGSRIETGE